MTTHPVPSRTSLRPLGHTGWLDNHGPTRFFAMQTLLGVVLTVGSAVAMQHPRALVGAWIFLMGFGAIVALFGGLGWLCATIARLDMQTCPKCLQAMLRGAQRCPHCRYEA